MSTISQKKADSLLVKFPVDCMISRIKHLREENPTLGLAEAKALVDSFRDRLSAKKIKMKVAFAPRAPKAMAAQSPLMLPRFVIPSDVLNNYHQKEVRDSVAHLAKALGKVDVSKGSPSNIEGGPLNIIHKELIRFLEASAAAL